MQTVIEIEPTKAAVLQAVLNLELIGFPSDTTPDQVTVEPYLFGAYQSSHDPRNGWDTYIVTIQGWGVIGFTDGPLTATEDPIDKGSPETVSGTATSYYGVTSISVLSPEEARRKRPEFYNQPPDASELAQLASDQTVELIPRAYELLISNYEVPFATSPFDEERRPPDIARDQTVMHHTVNGKGAVGRIK